MADILIQGMEMPKNGPLTITITPEGKVFRAFIPGSYGEAVSLPEGHGRLIDANALIREGADISDGYCVGEYCEAAEWGYSTKMIENAPTIVPAEGGTGDD